MGSNPVEASDFFSGLSLELLTSCSPTSKITFTSINALCITYTCNIAPIIFYSMLRPFAVMGKVFLCSDVIELQQDEWLYNNLLDVNL